MPLTHYLRLIALALLLPLLCSSISCFGNPWDDCRSPTECGEFKYSSPFGLRDSSCGDPNFLFDCYGEYPLQYPLLSINGEEYHILGNNTSHSIQIVNDKLWWDKCDHLGNYTQSWWYGSTPFYVADLYDNLTFWSDCKMILENLDFLQLCGNDWYYSFDEKDWGEKPKHSCKMRLQLPIKKEVLQSHNKFDNQSILSQGFEITWHDDRCGNCLNSNGTCGYNRLDQTEFLCYCRDGTSHPDICPGNGSGRKKRAIIIGCSIGGVALTAIAIVLFLRFYAKSEKHPSPRSSVSKVEKFLSEYAYEMPSRYSQSDLKKITKNFAEKLGEGGFGVVYKGKLSNGALVAVKLLDRHRHSETQFMNEVATIGRVHHVNLVRLLGYCFQSFTSALVYEYMVNGSLEKFIFAGKETGQVLRWEQLHSIALGVARGVAYLHQDCDKRIIHFDIKPHNILLGPDFTPKVADFGLAKLCGKGEDHISMTGARGTPGYVAPELCDTNLGPATDKSDVYSFGMLLLEIVGGRKNIDWKVSRSSQFYFPEWAFKLLEAGELGMRLREGLATEEEEKARRLTKVGLWCIQYNYLDRPSMSRVVQMLEEIGDDVPHPPLPFNSLAAASETPLLPWTEESSSIGSCSIPSLNR